MGFSYQLYSSRNFPPLSSTLSRVSKLGYTDVEGYGALYTDLDDLAGLKADLGANGLRMSTAHVGLDMVEDAPERVVEIARELGMDAIYVPFIMPEDRPTDAAGWTAFGQRLEAAGAPIRAAGFGFGYHNHDFEFVAQDGGEIPMDLVLAGGPSLEWEMDVAWVVRGGIDPVTYIRKYADRITAAHIKDIAPAGECEDEGGWADVGHGTMDWAGLMTELAATKAKHLVMEHDNPNDEDRFASRSIAAAQSFKG